MQMEQELTRTKSTTAHVVEVISSLTASLVEFKERSYNTLSEIRTAADLIINEVRTHEEKLVARVQEGIELKESSVQQQKKVLEDYVTELQQSIDYTSDVLNHIQENSEIDEWKTALTSQLQYLNGMKDNYRQDTNDEVQFLFIYANEDLLKSIANYGAIVNSDIPEAFRLKQRDGCDARKDDEGQFTVMPVVALNGAILDLDAVNDNYEIEESSDDELSDDDDDNDCSDSDT
ncbi:hypothetical protein QZH41_004140 [Actinostola sp. cb2023]|nr:hypothetical protein QZH41_004140 [Actinostola sp. cb2023]